MGRDSHQYITLLMAAGFLACLALTAAVYWPGLSGPFMLDDLPNIGRAYVAESSWDAFVFSLTHNTSGLLGRSVSILSFVLTGFEYGLDPFGYKYHNLLLHLLNGVLLFRLLHLLLPLLDKQLDERRVVLIVGVTTAAWLLHPLLVSTVLYAVQRMTQLSVLFTLLTLLAYVKARLELGSRWQFWLFGWCVMPTMMVLAVLSKEIGALLPLYLILLEVMVFGTSMRELRQSPRLMTFVSVFMLLPLMLAAVVLTIKFDSIVDYSNRTFSLQERLLTQLHVVAFYVRMILLPRIRAMSLFHDDYPITTSLDLVTALLLLVLLAILASAWRWRQRAPVVAFGLWWFVVSNLMESTFLPLELVFEHRNYLAAVGLLLPLVYVVFRFAVLKPLTLLTPVFVAVFAFMTATRAAEWGNDNLFYQMAVDEHPGSGRALNTFVNYQLNQGNYEKSVEYLGKLATLTPNEMGASLHMQVAKCQAHQYDAVAMAHALELAGKFPLSVYAFNALQNLLMLVVDGKCPEVKLEELADIVAAAISIAEPTGENHAHLLRLRGIIGFAKGQYAQGYSDFRTSHERTGNIALLHELMRYQLGGERITDAEETLALMETQNQARLGTDQYQVDLSRAMLERIKTEYAAASAARAANTTQLQ